MRNKIVSQILLPFLLMSALTLALNVQSVKATERTDVKMFVWNSASNSRYYPPKPYPTTTVVEIWIDAPDAWTDTPQGIVGWRVILKVDPASVQVVTALQYGDDPVFPDGSPDDFLGLYLSLYVGSGSVLWAPPLINDAAGTIEAGEAIAGFTTLGKGSGGALTKIDGSLFATTPSGDKLIPLCRFLIRTREGVTGPGSFLDLTEATYVTPDGVQHPVEVVEDGIYYWEPPPPDTPEFPFGLAPIMTLIPLIPIVYLWRTRKKRT